MNSLSSKSQRKSSWSPERRQAHRLAMRRWAPWTRSTGPRTVAGKAVSSKNALKHGNRAAPVRGFSTLFRWHNTLLNHIKTIVLIRRRFRYYACRDFTARLWKAFCARGMAGDKKIGANEQFNLARGLGLIRFPRRWERAAHKVGLVKNWLYA